MPSMETDAQTLPSSPHTFAGLTAQARNAGDADIRPTKKIRTEILHAQIGSGQPQGPDGIWHEYTGPSIGSGAHGTRDVEGISGLGMSSQSPYPPGSQYPIRPTEAAGFDQFPHWLGASGPGTWIPHTSCLAAAPQPLPGVDGSLSPGHPLWGHFLPSSPVHQITAAPPPYRWVPSAPPVSSLVAGQESYDRPEVDAVHHPLASLPTPPSVAGTEFQPYTRISLDPDNGCYSVPGYDHGTSGGPSNYPSLTQGLEDPVPLGNIVTSEFNQHGQFPVDDMLDEHHTPAILQHDTLSTDTGTLVQASRIEYSGPDIPAVKQPDDGDWIKTEHLEQNGGDGRKSMSVEGQLSNSPPDGACELSRHSHDPDGDGSRDRKRRARFDESLRRETSNTRTMGACLRCHNQRVRCTPNKLDPLGPCETCLKVRKDSKKTIHNIPCVRYKVTSMTVYRAGGLGLTERFDHTKVVDISDYSDDVIYGIEITQGLCESPLPLRVRRFRPKETDVTHRRYMDGGVPKTQDTGAFCLADVEKTATDFGEYIDLNAFEGLVAAVNASDDIVRDVFAMIATHCASLPDTIKGGNSETIKEARRNPAQKDFLQKLVRLWFAIRHGTGSAWICGKEDLGMGPGFGRSHPLPGRISVPRMIVAQFDSIRYDRIYKKLYPDVLRSLDTYLASCNKEAWFTVFLATFLLLHQVACTSEDRYRYVRENEVVNPRVRALLETRYGAADHPLTAFIEEVHRGAVMLLTHWQYFKRCDLMNFSWEDIEGSVLVSLEPYQVQFLKRTIERLKEKLPSVPTTPKEGCWEHELFWVSKMFVSEPSQKAGWTAPEIFTRAKPSVGRD